ncbi:hypothetical protein MILUP08_42011 [Micromonospora lupini str. Lupac 08]|uniref:Uncharacterized protein n=1 Tax=Micromonospora lupini str. Lupac 08 TaxID=1150864 RepID=I0KZU5_9ACTN|nr:hypothetical protein MILUP08_42011 [Micromonospora lupini str. Lupac 08]
MSGRRHRSTTPEGSWRETCSASLDGRHRHLRRSIEGEMTRRREPGAPVSGCDTLLRGANGRHC